MKFLRFLQYNNAVPIAVSLVLLGAGSAFAASNPDAILSSKQNVLSVDNTYIANKELASYTPEVTITGVTEDEEYYYVAYDFTTIDIRDYVWRDFTRSERMQVSKKELDGKDLGVYVTGRFRDVIANERLYLAQVQEKERKAVTQQTVATTYSGLIGRFLDATTETLPGYTPVIQEEIPAPSSQAAAVVASGGAIPPPLPAQGASTGPAQIALQVLGNNPAQVALRASYVDLGVVFLDPYGVNVGVHTFLNGAEVSSINIDTSIAAAHVVEYRATDPAGGVAYVKRIVLVGGAEDPGGAISSSGTPVAPPPKPAPEPEPAPAPQQQQQQPEAAPPAPASETTPAPEAEISPAPESASGQEPLPPQNEQASSTEAS
jgi:hypothetical protein